MATKQTIQQGFKACGNFTEFQFYHVFGTSGISAVDMDVLTGLLTKDQPTDNYSDMREANDFFKKLQMKDASKANFVD